MTAVALSKAAKKFEQDPRCFEVGAYITHNLRVYQVIARDEEQDQLWLEDICTDFPHARPIKEVGSPLFSLVKPAPEDPESE